MWAPKTLGNHYNAVSMHPPSVHSQGYLLREGAAYSTQPLKSGGSPVAETKPPKVSVSIYLAFASFREDIWRLCARLHSAWLPNRYGPWVWHEGGITVVLRF